MTAPRLELDLDRIGRNAATLVGRLGAKGIRVTGVTKAVLGSPALAATLTTAGVVGLADSRVENLARLRAAGSTEGLTLLRSPMLGQVPAVVRHADASFNTEHRTLDALAAAAVGAGTVHGVVIMVELGDLREGVPVADAVELARSVSRRSGLRLVGLGTNLACQSGVVPGPAQMDELSRLVEQVEAACGTPMAVVSGGNSSSLGWALRAHDVGRIDDLRLGESILLGTDPLHRRPLQGLETDACRFVAEVIEVQTKPAQPWGAIGQGAFGPPTPRPGRGSIRQAILAVGHHDTDPAGLVAPPGLTILGASSDHLVVHVTGEHVAVGDEISFGVDYSALVRAASSPFVATVERVPIP